MTSRTRHGRNLLVTMIEVALRAIGYSGPVDADTPLLGSAIDSIQMVELLVRLEDETGCGRLLGNPEVIEEGGPLETVGSLIAYLEAK